MKKLKNLSPIALLAACIFIGIVCVALLSIISSLVITSLYPEMQNASLDTQMQQYPVQFMVSNYIPFQIGLFFIPGFIYLKLFKNKGNTASTKWQDYLWCFVLFICLLCLLPFFTTLNSKILAFLVF